MEAWISSRVLPFVSGTSMTMNTMAAAQTTAYPKNVPERPYCSVDVISLTKQLQYFPFFRRVETVVVKKKSRNTV